MTKTMLERAARAAADVYFGPYVVVAYPTSSVWTDVARAVLMAVREPDEAMSQAVRTTEGWEDMIDAILNEPQP